MVKSSKIARTGVTLIQYALVALLVSAAAFTLVPVFQNASQYMEKNRVQHNEGKLNTEGSFTSWFKPGGGEKGASQINPSTGLGSANTGDFNFNCGPGDFFKDEEKKCGGIPGACGVLKDGCWICNDEIAMWQWEPDTDDCNKYWYNIGGTCSAECTKTSGYMPLFKGIGTGTDDGYCYICSNSYGYWYLESDDNEGMCTSFWSESDPPICFGGDDSFEAPCGTCTGHPPLPGYYLEKNGATLSCWICQGNQWINTTDRNTCIESWINVSGSNCPSYNPTEQQKNLDYPDCLCRSDPPARGPNPSGAGYCYVCDGGVWIKEGNEQYCNDFWIKNKCKIDDKPDPPSCNGLTEPTGDPGAGNCWLCTNPMESYRKNPIEGDLYDIFSKPCNIYWTELDYPAFLNIPGNPDNINTVCSEPFSSLDSAEPGIAIDPITNKWGCWACTDKSMDKGVSYQTNYKIWARLEWEGSRFSPLTSGSQSTCSTNTDCSSSEMCTDERCVDKSKYSKYKACHDFWMEGIYPAADSISFPTPENGVTYAHGSTTNGKLGIGPPPDSTGIVSPLRIVQNSLFKQVSAGYNHSCGIDYKNRAWCWGNNQYGQLGNNKSGTNSNTPVLVSTDILFKEISARGEYHTCGIDLNDEAWCWGRNNVNQLGLNAAGGTYSSPQRVIGSHRFKDISAGKNHACAIDTSGGAWCWGGEVSGVLGSGNAYFPSGSNPPLQARTITRVAGGHNFVEISTSTDHTCALDIYGKVWCWGSNFRADTNRASMKLGVYMASYLSYPAVPIEIRSELTKTNYNVTFSAITTGDKHSCALESTGRIWCWGNNSFKQVGTNLLTNSPIEDTFFPIPISEGHLFTQIDSLGDHTCAVTQTGDVYCWGDNSKNQADSLSNSPVIEVPRLEYKTNLTFRQVSAGYDHTLFVSGSTPPQMLRPLGKLKVVAWGKNNSGQLGDNTTTNRETPVSVITGNYNFIKVVAGETQSCGLTSTGKAYCWGNDKLNNKKIPSEVTGLSNVTDIFAGDDGTCVKSNHILYCWGVNTDGQLGTGAKESTVSTPTAIATSYEFNGLVMGGEHTCAISPNIISPICWGQDNYGQLGNGTTTGEILSPSTSGIIKDGENFIKFAAGQHHSCAIDSDHKALCWGRNHWSQLAFDGGRYSWWDSPHGVHTGLSDGFTEAVMDIALGDNHTCVLTTNGKVWCAGKNNHGQCGTSSSYEPYLSEVIIWTDQVSFKQISSGGEFTCGIDTEGKAWCWGRNDAGQLGTGGNNASYEPVQVAGDYYFESIACGKNHCVALVWDTSGGGVSPDEPPPLPEIPSGPAYGWGYNGYGQIGDGSTEVRPLPVPLNKTFFDVSAGHYHACGLDINGKAWCWGRNMHGEIGMNPYSSYETITGSPVKYYPSPIEVASRESHVFKKISSGDNHTCAIDTAGKAWCWGYNEFGQLGIGYKDDYNLHYMPEAVSGDIVFTDIAVGNYHTCAISASGVVGCWGNNSLGQLGIDLPDAQTTPYAIGGNAIQISSSSNHTCVIDTVGDAYCWGDNSNGQIGTDLTSAVIPAPTKVRKDLATCANGTSCPITVPLTQISAGVHHSCAIDITGKAWCWGLSKYGEAGSDTIGVVRNVPHEVRGGHKFKEIHAGEHVTCGITTSGEGYCWGYDGHGELGSSQPHSLDYSATPLKVDGGHYLKIKPAIGGGNHTIAIADPSGIGGPTGNEAGLAFGWGDNINYTLGVNAKTNSVLYPRGVVNKIEFVQVSASQSGQFPYYCGIDKNGQAWCWGSNVSGQLGNNTMTESIVPVKVAGAHKFQQISAGYAHTCAIDKDEQAWCWGDNSSSQLGHNIDDTQKLIPVKVAGSHKFKKITTGFNFTCAVDREGKAWCWGTSSSGQLGGELEPGAVRKTPSLASSNYLFKDIDAGNYFVCGVATDGAGYCWGDNGAGQLGALYGMTPTPADYLPNANTPTAISSYTAMSDDPYNWTPIKTPFIQISAGGATACALETDGTAWCWGNNSYYQTGDMLIPIYDKDARALPVKVNTNEKFKSIEVGLYHTCGIIGFSSSLPENTVMCWGSNSNGQLGLNTNGGTRKVPTAVVSVSSSPNKFRQISLGANSSLGVSFVKDNSTPTIPDGEEGAEGITYGWGYNSRGQIGDGTANTPRTLPVPLDVPEDAPAFKQVEAGMQHSCAIDNHDSIWCWGDNSYGRVNGESGGTILSPTKISFPQIDNEWKQVAVGMEFTCAIEKRSGVLYCWGDNDDGQLGLGHRNSTSGATAPIPLKKIKQVSAGFKSTCALDMGGQAWCWGYNSLGQVGDNSSGNLRTSPVKVWGDHTFTSISLKGGEFACALDISGQAWCWGRDDMGQLGDNQDGSSLIYFPVKVVGNHTFSQVSAGIYHACALDTAGKAWCWGNGADGQLGNGSVDRKYIPTPVSNDYYKTISAGGHHTCALDFSGRAVCWGNNEDGQLGDGSGNSQSNVPVFVDTSSLPGSTAFEQISAGGSHVLAISRNPKKEEEKPVIPGNWLEGNTKLYQYGGTGNENGYAIADADDYVYIAGSESSDKSHGSTSLDIVVLKIKKSDGSVIWKKQIGGNRNDEAKAIKVAPDGSVYVTGYETSTTAGGNHDIVVIKLKPDGDVLWKKEYGGGGQEYGNAIDISSDGLHVYITGQESSASAGGYVDIVVMKLKADDGTLGTTGWIKQYGGAGNDVGEAIVTTVKENEDEILIAGHQQSSQGSVNKTDAFVMKIKADGSVAWKKQYGTTSEERALAMFISGTSIYVTGYTTNGTTDEDIFVMQLKYEGEDGYDDGAVQWKARYGGAEKERGLGITALGNFIYVVGEQESNTKGGKDLFAMEIKDNKVEWKNRAGGATDDLGNDIIIGKDGKLYIAGSESSESNGGGTSFDILLMQLDRSQSTSNISWAVDGVDISGWNVMDISDSGWTENGSNINTSSEWMVAGDWNGESNNITNGTDSWTMTGMTITPADTTTTGKWVK